MQKTDLEDGMVFARVCSYVCVRVYERGMTCAYEHQRLFHRDNRLHMTPMIYTLSIKISTFMHLSQRVKTFGR